MRAVYRLNKCRVNFNFLEFLVAASTLGVTHIVIDKTRARLDYPEDEAQKRLESIVEPACALAGCGFSYGSEKPDIDVEYHISSVIEAHRQMPRGIKKLKSVLPKKNEKYTVTLRNSLENPNRNSNESGWREFADEIGAFVIEDYNDKPIHLHERMAYYAGAEMNYFVANGPSSLCLLSDFPYTIFMNNVNEEYHVAHGWWMDQLPWATKNQVAVWLPDTIENIRRYKPVKLEAA